MLTYMRTGTLKDYRNSNEFLWNDYCWNAEGLLIKNSNTQQKATLSVADPEFDLRGGVDLIKIMLKINCKQSDRRKNWEKLAFWA